MGSIAPNGWSWRRGINCLFLKNNIAMSKTQSKSEFAFWPEIIKAVKNHVGLYALLALVLLSMVTGLGLSTTGSARVLLVVCAFFAFTVLVVAITYLLYKQVAPSNPTKEVIPLANRDEYIQKQITLLAAARNRVCFILNKIHHASPERTDAMRINNAIAEAARRGVQIRLIVGATDECLPAAVELSRNANTEVRFDPSLAFADVNYVSVDESSLVIGIRQVLRDSSAYQASKEWYHILSSTMVSAMNSVFLQRWDAPSTSTLEQMLRRSIPRIVSGNGRESVSRQLGLTLAEVDKYTECGPFIVVLIGRPGSGKTTVAKSIVSSLSDAGISAVHYSDFEYFRELFLTVGSDKFERTSDGGFYVTDRLQFENATKYLADCVEKSGRDVSLVVLEMARGKYVEALRILKDRGVSIDLAVYIDVDYRTAVLRNTWRKEVDGGHFVSEKEMQTTFTTDDVREIERRLGPLFFKLPNPDTRHDDQKVMAGQILSRFRSALATKWPSANS